MSDALKMELGEILRAWGSAIVSNDADAIGEFAADAWMIVGTTGATTKEAFLDVVRSGDLTHDTFEVEVLHAHAYGDCAVAISHVSNTGMFRGERFTSDEWTAETFVHDGNGWLCVLTALTPCAS